MVPQLSKGDMLRDELTVIHLEDSSFWNKQVKNELSHNGVTYQNFITVTNVADIQATIQAISGPKIVIVDLRFETNDQTHMSGHYWLLREMPLFLRESASLIRFYVLSGQVGEPIRKQLIANRVDNSRIFSKGKWSNLRSEFVQKFRLDAAELKRIAAKQDIESGLAGEIESGKKLTNADESSPLDTKLDALLRYRLIQSQASNPDTTWHSVIIYRSNNSWEPKLASGLRIISQTGELIGCHATSSALIELTKNVNVSYIEAGATSERLETHETKSIIDVMQVHDNLAEFGNSAAVAVIDDGIDIKHQTFTDKSGATRILAYWDQTDNSGSPPQGYDFGRFYSQAEINQLTVIQTTDGSSWQSFTDHGTHVASIAAGRPVGGFTGGIAPEAKIIAVKLDFGKDSSSDEGNRYGVNLLAALTFVRDTAIAFDLPVVINLSHGTNMGAHNGFSQLERICDNITDVGVLPGVVIVKAAGNEGDALRHSRVIVAGNSARTLTWLSKESDIRQTDIIEAWFQTNKRLRFRLYQPGGESSAWVDYDHTIDDGTFTNGNKYSLIHHYNHFPSKMTRVRVSVGRDSVAPIRKGEWQLQIENLRDVSVEVDAWISNSSPDESPIFTSFLERRTTLTIPATARSIIAVGAIAKSTPLQPWKSTSIGPTLDNRLKPEVVAPGDCVSAIQSNTQNSLVTKSGTSQAAPHVSGAIALLLSHRQKKKGLVSNWTQLNANDVSACLLDCVSTPGSDWDDTLGYGLINVQKLIKACP
jgi:endonuclease G